MPDRNPTSVLVQNAMLGAKDERRSGNAIQQNRLTDRSWEYINPSQIHECRNWEGGLAVSFLGIFVQMLSAVY
jgi:hypothetical protein